MSLITTTFSQVSPAYTVHSFDVGYVVEITGFNKDEIPEWTTVKITAMTVEDIGTIITEINQLPKVQ